MEYLSSADQHQLNEHFRKIRLVVLALAASILIYIVIGYLLASSRQRIEPLSWGRGLYLAAIVIGLGAVTLRRLLHWRLRSRPVAQPRIAETLSQLGIVSITGAALGEAISILGLIACLLTGDFEYSWRLGVIGLMLIAYSFPRRREWERTLVAIKPETSSQAGQ